MNVVVVVVVVDSFNNLPREISLNFQSRLHSSLAAFFIHYGMINNSQNKKSAFLVILGLALAWVIGAYGSPMGFPLEGNDIFRERSRWIIAIAGLAGIALLPGTKIFPRLPWTLWVCFGFLILWGCFMVINAHSEMNIYRTRWIMIKDRPFPDLPGSPVASATKKFTFEIIAVFLFIIAIARSAESAVWKRIITAFALASLSVALIGMTHKILGIETVWGITDEQPELIFAPYIYNGNAASMMNLGVIIALSLALTTYRKNGSGLFFYLWLCCGAVIGIAILAASSKAGALILIGQLGLFVLLEGKTLLKIIHSKRRRKLKMSLEKKMALGASAIILAGFTIISTGLLNTRFQEMFEDIENTGEASTIEGRVEMMKLMMKLSADPEEAYWHGIGPGTFPYVTPYYRQDPESKIIGVWEYGHCDPLQTIMDWGYFGALAWFTIGIGGVARGAYLLLKDKVPENDLHLVKGIVISLIGVGIHSSFDFPLSILSIHLIAISYCVILWCIYRGQKSDELDSTS
ncbi:O-antigen ligase family protein [Akkermansiaceae bacterium]|nr:O-antigen ligase family protein [Akkermansiaceae bacterium]